MHPYISTEVVRERRQRYMREAQAWRTPPAPVSHHGLHVARQALGWALVRAGLRIVQHPPDPVLRSP